jgi:predicted nucleic acid-binding protein
VTLVVDASVAAKWFIEEAGRQQALRLLEMPDRQAPDLLVVEVANIAWKKTLRGEIGATQAQFICASVAHCFDTLHSSDSLIERAAVMALDLRHPVYDCLYLACAERCGARLVTADRRLITTVLETPLAALVMRLDDL